MSRITYLMKIPDFISQVGERLYNRATQPSPWPPRVYALQNDSRLGWAGRQGEAVLPPRTRGGDAPSQGGVCAVGTSAFSLSLLRLPV